MKPLDPRVLPHLRPARRALVGVVAGNVVTGVLLVAQAFTLTGLLSSVLDLGPGSGDGTRDDSWLGYAVAFSALVAARALVGAAVSVAAQRSAAQVGGALRRLVLARAVELPATELDQHRRGELAVLATRGVAAVEPYLTRYLPALVLAAVLPALTWVAVLTQDWLSAVVIAVTLPLVPVFAALIGLRTQDRAERQWRVLGQLAGHFVDVVRGLPTLVAFRRGDAQAPRIREITDRYRRANRDVLRLAFASSAALELLATLSVALVAVIVGLRLAAGDLDFGTAMVVLLLAPEAYWPWRRVGAEFHAAAEGTATFEAISALTQATRTTRMSPESRGDAGVPREGALVLDGVEVTWPGRSAASVGPVDAVIPRIGITAIVGPSGCGKSTLLAALAGDTPLSGGRIQIGDLDLAQVDPAAWRAAVAVVPQRAWLVEGTVADNLRIGRPDASASLVCAALQAVDLKDELPAGIGTRLTGDGSGLSAGQAARLSLARAWISERPVLLLDEPSAHLDARSEAVLVRVLQSIARERCVVVVAHRAPVVSAAATVISLPARATALPGGPRADHVVSTARGPRADDPPRETPRRATSQARDPGPSRSTGWWTRAAMPLAVALGVLASTAGVALTATAGWLIARAAEQPPVLMLTVAIVGVRTFGLARPVLRYAERLLSHDVALRALADRRAEIYSLLVPLVPGRLGRDRGDLLASVVDDVDAELDARLRVRMPLVVWLGTTVLAAALMCLWHPVAGVLTGLLTAATGAATWRSAVAGSRRFGAEAIRARAEVSQRVLWVLENADGLRQWQRSAFSLQWADRASQRLGLTRTRAAGWTALSSAWPLLGAAIGVPLVITIAGGDVTGPTLALLVLTPLALAEVTGQLTDAGTLRDGARAARARLDSLADLGPTVHDPDHPLVPDGTGSWLGLLDVSAGYGDAPAIEGVTLAVGAGDSLGIVGPSGSGKSTIAGVLVRLLDPSDGTYLLDGIDTRDLRGDDVRRDVGLLPDDPYLFASTVAENVRLARPGATDAAVRDALVGARLGDWVDELPRGLDTFIGDGGLAVSGGERSRIGLARMLLAQQRLWVLDEPTAHLDRATADLVVETILERREGTGVVWISHDGRGLDRLDRVLDLETGETSDTGGAQPVTAV